MGLPRALVNFTRGELGPTLCYAKDKWSYHAHRRRNATLPNERPKTMKMAKLLVETGSGSDPEDWSFFGFVDPPSAGDKLTIERASLHELVVLGLHHHPVARLDDKSASSFDLPQASILAKII